MPRDEAQKRHARDAAQIASLTHEREGLLARIADLEEETRSLAGADRRSGRPPRRSHRRNPYGARPLRNRGNAPMPLVNVMVNQRSYTVACDEGEQEHLQELAAHVDAKVRGLLKSVGAGRRTAAARHGRAPHRGRIFRVRSAPRQARAGGRNNLAGARDEITTRLAAREREAGACWRRPPSRSRILRPGWGALRASPRTGTAPRVRTAIPRGLNGTHRELSLTGAVASDIWRPPALAGP